MKKQIILLGLSGLILLLGACVPNRLQQSLSTQEETTPNPAASPTVSLAAPTPDGRNLQPQLANANIDLSEVATLLPPDAIPAILPDEVDEIMVSAAEAEQIGINPATRVLGVSINDDSRAYPVPYMSSHEIVNDEVGGRLIAATW